MCIDYFEMPNPNPKPPKRRKSSSQSRHARAGQQKNSKYNYEAAREDIGIPNATAQTVNHHQMQRGPNPPKEKSPLKSEYKSMLKQKEEEVNSLLDVKKKIADENSELRQSLTSKDSKIAAQKGKINELTQLLQEEKKKSRSVIAKLMDDADMIMAEAHSIKDESNEKVAAVDAVIDHTKERHKEMLHQERHQYSKQLSAGKFNLRIVSSLYLYCISHHVFV